jgi:chaperonin GroES
MVKTKKTKIIPRGQYVLVKPDGEDSRTNENGLIIPAKVEQEQKATGVVEAVSSEVKDIKVGDRVAYGVYAGESIKQREDGKEVERKLLHSDDIIAFLR